MVTWQHGMVGMSETLMDVAVPVFRGFSAMTVAPGVLPPLALPAPPVPIAWMKPSRAQEASRSAPHHVWLAGTRLRIRLIGWAAAEQSGALSSCDPPTAIAMLVADGPTRALLADALAKAASALSLTDVAAVTARLDALALDLGAVEAVRERALEKTKALVRRLANIRGGEAGQRRLVRQCALLLISALSGMQARLRAADDCANDVLAALRDMGGAQSLLRCCGRIGAAQGGWARMLALWDAPAEGFDLPGALSQTHAFLIAATMGDTTSGA